MLAVAVPRLALMLRRKVWQRSWLSPPRFLQVSATFPPSTHHVSSSLPAYIDLILFPYCFRIVSASGSENDRRTIGEQYGIDTGSIRNQYGIDTRMIRDDSQLRFLTRYLTFSSIFLCIIFYILFTRYTPSFMQRWLTHQ